MIFLMTTTFVLVTPIGMAISLGVSKPFSGNPSTPIAVSTLDAVAVRILVCVGVVDIWALDWVVAGGHVANSGLLKTMSGATALAAGMILMGRTRRVGLG